jgi:aspartate racemase
MKTIGIIGGTSWESTAIYYRILNQETNRRLGGSHSACIRMYSFDFDEVEKFNKSKNLDGLGIRVVEEAIKLEKAGAELLMLGANTLHMFTDKIRASVNIPLIHIADATGKVIKDEGIEKVLLLGTKYTMQGRFISGKLEDEYRLSVVVPELQDQDKINDIIYNELICGKFTESSKQTLLRIIDRFSNIGGVILGCTELPLLLHSEDCRLKLFNTTEIHAKAAVEFALNNG